MSYRHVAAGGTFDLLHLGHKALLRKAVEAGGFLTIGVTSDEFAVEAAETFEARRRAVERFLAEEGCRSYRIVELNDPYGPAVSDSSMDALVVSEETYHRGLEINRLRLERGLGELALIKIDMVPAEDGGELSSTRIRRGEIDREGRVL